ncbi:adhesion G-protein coupled receptor D1-like isoform X2 [Ptychodera flava]|uniref:adhesion G-protein coupled receptor D1-like isoform X2 n=1 Tax=Ptychodera flava TaxID=63121 RepID=UPI00396A89F8
MSDCVGVDLVHDGVLLGKWSTEICPNRYSYICEVDEKDFVTPPPAVMLSREICDGDELQFQDHPDYFELCVSEDIQVIKNRFSASESNANSSLEILLDLNEFMAITPEITVGDLLSASQVASGLMNSGHVVLKSDELATADKDAYIQECLEITSLLLNESNSAKWKMIEQGSNKEIFVDLIEATESLINDVTIELMEVGPSVMNITTENIDVAISVQETADAVEVVVPATELFAPSAVVPEELLRRSDAERIGVFSMIYHSFQEVLSYDLSSSSGLVKLGSDVISISVYPEIPTPFSERITMSFPKGKELQGKELMCGYMDYDDSESLWKSDGVEIVSERNDMIQCHSTHLTNFALMMKVSHFKIDHVHKRALEIITEVGCGISFSCLLLTFAVFAYFRLNSERVIILQNLVIALAMAQLMFLSATSATHNPALCTTVAIILHYLFLATFFWMFAQGVQLYLKVSTVFAPSNNVLPYYFMLGWGVPVIIVAITASIRYEHYGDDIICWLSSSDGVIYAFVGPVICIIVINTAVLIFVMKAFMGVRANARKSEAQKIRSGFRACLILLPLLGLTWIFGIFAFNNETLIFAYVFAVFNSLQVRNVFRKKFRSSSVSSCSHGLAWIDSGKSAMRVSTNSASSLTKINILSLSSSNTVKKISNGIATSGV